MGGQDETDPHRGRVRIPRVAHPAPQDRWGTRGTTRVYTYPSKKSLASIIDRIRILTRRTAHRTLADLLRRLNPAIRGWCAYFQHGVSKRTFCYVDNFAFRRILGRRLQAPPPPEQAHRQPPVPARVAHPGRRNRVLPSLQGPRDPLPLPGNPHPQSPRRRTPRHNTGGEPDAQECARPVRRAAGGNPPAKTRAGRRRPTLHLHPHVGRIRVSGHRSGLLLPEKVVGYAMAAGMKTDLICKATGYGRAPLPPPGGGHDLPHAAGATSTPHSNSPGTWSTTGSAPP